MGAERCIDLICTYFGTETIKLKDARNRTPLHIAALHGHVDCAKYLLEKGAEIECKDADGRTPLVAAAQNGQSQIIGSYCYFGAPRWAPKIFNFY